MPIDVITHQQDLLTGCRYRHVLVGSLQRNFPSLRWDQILKGKRDINYGQPVLVGFGIVPLNPVRVMIVLAHQFILKTEGRHRALQCA